MNFAGDKERIRIQKFGHRVFFEYRDITSDKIPEYIFVSGNELSVFSQNESELFSYEFKEEISQAPLIYILPDGSAAVGMVSGQSNELYLFNGEGKLYSGFPVSGKTPFSIGDINNDGVPMLVTGSSDNSIFVYQLKASSF